MDSITDFLNKNAPVVVPDEAPSLSGEFSKGVSRGLRELGASSLQGVGLGAEALGYNDTATALRAKAKGLRDEEAAFAPEVGSWDEVHGPGQAVRWVMGHAGQLVPVVAGAAAGGAVAGPVGAAASMLPGQFGAIDYGQQADPRLAALPVQQRLQNAALPAIGSAALMAVPGEAVFGKLGFPAAKSLSGALVSNVGKGAATGYTTMGGADAMVQKGIDPDAPVNWDQAHEAGVGGAVAVGAMHVPHVIPSMLKGAGESIGDSAGQVKLWGSKKLAAMKEQGAGIAEGAADMAAEAPKKVNSLWDDVMEFTRKGKEQAADLTDKVLNSEPITYTHEQIRGATPDKVWEMVEGNAKAVGEWAKSTGDALLNKMGLDDPRRAELKDALSGLADPEQSPTAARVIAGIKAAREQADRAQKNLTDLVNHLRSGEKDDPNVKKSAEEDGVTDIVKQVLAESGLKTSRPDIFDPKHKDFRPATSNAQVTSMARAMRDLVRGALKGPLDENTKLLAFKTFGPDTVPVMDAVARAVGGSDLNRGAAENLFKNITDIQKKETMLNDLHRTIIESSAPGMEKLNHANMDMLVGLLTRHADSQFEPRGGFRREGALSKTEGDNGAQNPATQAIEHYITQIYQQRFGKNADTVREAVQRAIKAEKGDEHTGPRFDEDLGEYSDEEKAPKTPRGQSILRDADGNKIGSIRKEGEFDNDGNRLEAETLNVTKYGLSAPDKAGNQKLVRNGRMYRDVRTSAERDAGGKPNYVTQHLADLRAKYPDKSVEWVESSPAQYDKAGKLVKHAEGHIEVSEKMDESQISDGDMEAMALDTHKHPNSKSRIDFVDKDGNPIAKYKALDSVAVGRVLYGRKLGSYEPDHRVSFAEQIRDNFIEGISSIAQKYNAMPRIPDEAVIGYTKEGPLTWGDAKKLGRAGRRETPDEMRMAELHQHLNELEKQAFLMTAPDAVIRALNEKLAAQAKEAGRPAPKEIRRINASRDDVKDIKDIIKKIDKEMAVLRNKELSQEADVPRDEKAEAVRHLDPTRPRNGTTEAFNRPPELAEKYNRVVELASKLAPGTRAKALTQIREWYDSEIAKANPRVRKEKYKDDVYATTAKDGKRTLNNPVDPYDSIWKTEYDENGNLVRGGITREGVRQLLEGNYDGGIRQRGELSRIVEGEQKGIRGYDKDGLPIEGDTVARTTDPLDRFDGGQGRQEMGKDEQVHLQFAGRGKQDRPFFGRPDEDGRPIEDLVHRSNMDGTPHFISDRWSQMQSMQLMGHELKARVGVANRKLGERIVALAKPEVLAQMPALDYENFLLGTMPDMKISSRAKIINPLFEKYTTREGEVITTREARLAAKEKGNDKLRGVTDYGDREYAFQELQNRIDVMSDRMAEYELKRREFMLKTGYGDADLQKVMQTEVGMLKKRLANGRPAVPDVQFNDHADWLGYKWKDVEGNDLFSQGTTKRKLVRDSNPYEGMYDVGRKPQPLRISDDIKDLGEPRTGDPRFGDARTGEVDVTNGSGDLRTGELNLGKPVEAPTKNTPKSKKAADQEFRTTEDRLMELFGGTPEPEGSRVMEGSPGPKAVAAKKAALEQAASSSDPALHEQLANSTDAPSLKRTVDHLNTVEKPDAGTVEAIELANKRIGELNREDPQNAYGMQLARNIMVDPARAAEYGSSPFATRLFHYTTDRNVESIGREGYSKDNKTPVFNIRKEYGIRNNSEHAFFFTEDGGPDARWNEHNKVGKLGRIEGQIDPNANLWRPTFDDLYKIAKKVGVRYDDEGDVTNPPKLFRKILEHVKAEGYDGVALHNIQSWTLRQYAGDSMNGDHIIFNPKVVAIDKGFDSAGNRKFSLDSSRPDGTQVSPEIRTAVEDYIKRVAPKVALEWKGLSDLPYAGDYNHVAKLVRLSVHANNPMGTAFHEAMHHFIGSMRDAGAKDVAAVLERAASQKHVIDQLNEIYKGKPEVLAQLRDPEERAAYMYQHWALDPNFKVSIAAKGVFGKIAQFIRNMFGMWSNDERALHIMDYFHKGEFGKNADKPNYVREQLMNTHRNELVEKFKDIVEPAAQVADAIVSAGGARLRDTDIPAIQTIADLIKRQHTDDRGGDRGFVPAQRIEMTKRLHAFGEGLEKFLPPEGKAPGLMTKALESATGIKAPTTIGRAELMRDTLEALQRGERASTPEGRLLASFVKKTLRETRQYMVDAGVKIGDLGTDYFPREWDMHYISKNQQAFRDMLEPYIRSGQMKGTADQLVRNLTSQGGSEIGIEGRNGRETREPGMQFKKERMLAFIDPRDAAPFLKKDLMSTMASYITQATRKAEWTRRLGNGKLEHLIDEARSQGAEQKHLDLVEDYLKANDGTLGDTLNPTARRLMGDMIVYQNVRLLPLASFSMMIDPLGTVVRGAKVGEAWNTFKRGMAGIRDTFKKEGEIPRDKATEWAELVGVVDSAMMSHAMSDVFTQGMVGGFAKDVNQSFFKYNFVEGLNRNFRIGATESAMKFIVRHADGKASPHSMRWFKELGLQNGDVKMHDGRLALTQAEGLSAESEARVHAAINQWVDGAILRPDAADKPIWMNDPHYALISHLKQFVYSFQHTILERVGHEFKHGNYAPAMALASYLPTMMAADFAKNFIVNGGGQPDWQKGWDMWDYVENGVERSGFYGVNQFWIDAAKDIHRGNTGIFRLAGPTIEQGRDAIETLGGRRQFSSTAIDALPANALYRPMLGHSDKADPVFAE